MGNSIFNDHGYIITRNLAGLTYREAEKIIHDELRAIQATIEEKEKELKPLRSYLSVLEYNLRGLWLHYKDET